MPPSPSPLTSSNLTNLAGDVRPFSPPGAAPTSHAECGQCDLHVLTAPGPGVTLAPTTLTRRGLAGYRGVSVSRFRFRGALCAAGMTGGLLSLVSGVGPATAAHVVCGQVITQNTVLDGPVGPCLTDGIIIGASGITLDLNGFTVSGVAGQLTQGVGVRLAGHSGVTVTNGTVTKFQAGVSIENGASNTVSDLTAVENTGGDGIVISGATSDNNNVLNNAVLRNGPFDGIGVYGGTSADKLTGTVISGNLVQDNATSGMTGGIRLENWTWNTTVSNNTVTGSALEGIANFADTQFNTITDNTVDGNGFNTETDNPRAGDGIRSFPRSANHTISDNTVTNNGGNGIYIVGPLTLGNGTTVVGSTNNSITDNTATGNNAKPTILVDEELVYLEGRLGASVTVNGQTTTVPAATPAYDLHDGNPNCDNNVWLNNIFGTRNPASCVS
jgi:parallel beta-helix repeat protein